MVNIQESRLCSLEKDLFVCFSCLGKKMRCFANERPESLDQRRDLVVYFVSPKRLLAIKDDNAIRFFEISLDPHSECFG